jgi:hypothetical protein
MRQVVSGFEGKIFKQSGGHYYYLNRTKNRRIVPESTILSIN